MKLLDSMGEPDLKLAHLALWIHGRQFEELHDYWDGNWLYVTAHCEKDGAAVTASGPFLRNTELVQWAEECRALLEGRGRVAELATMEPELRLEMEMNHLGQIRTTVEISPDPLNQEHKFIFDLDQSYLPDLIRAIARIEARFPVRGAP